MRTIPCTQNYQSGEIWRYPVRIRRDVALRHLREMPSEVPPRRKNNRCDASLRRLLVPDGVVPASIPSLRSTMTNIASVGNPWGQEPNERANWAKDLGVKQFDEATEVFYFPCCYPSYDPRLKKVAQATATILNKAGVDFGILGSKEMCCGESVRKAGNETLFKRLARENIKTFIESGVKENPCFFPSLLPYL